MFKLSDNAKDVLTDTAVEEAIGIEASDDVSKLSDEHEARSRRRTRLYRHGELKPLDPRRDFERIGFSRSREVEFKWDEVFSNEADGENTPYFNGVGVEYMRREFERNMGMEEGVYNATQFAQFQELVQEGPRDNWFLALRSSSRSNYPANKRSYWFYPDPAANIDFTTISPLADFASYEDFWSKVGGVSAETKEKTEFEVVDLAPAIIYRQYRQLRQIESLGQKLSVQADKLADGDLEDFLSPEEINAISAGYLRMKSVGFDASIQLERLKQKARDQGYYLALETEEIELPDGTKDTLQPGQLYQPYTTVIEWTTTQFRTVIYYRRSFFSSRRYTIKIPYERVNRKQITRFRRFIPDFDPWVEKEQELVSQGFQVFRFERVGGEYVAPDGLTLGNILELCELDPVFHNRCAILIPVYEQSFVLGEFLAKYLVFKKPRRGAKPIQMPALYVEEDLSFVTKFLKVEVGELVQSINLSPGEERTISVERVTTEEIEERRSTTSITDLTESARVDLATEMEKEFSNSTEKTSTSSLSAKAGGSYGGFSASASGSTSSTVTTKQFARNLQKVARKSSRAVTRKTRNEVNTSSTYKSSVSTRETTNIEIKNINEGATLNLLFFQLYNIFSLSLRLERISFTYIDGIEVVAGSGIVVPRSFAAEELPELIEALDVDRVGVFPNRTMFPGPDAHEKAKEAYRTLVLGWIKETLKEYKVGEAGSSDTVQIGNWEPPAGPPPPELADFVAALAEALASVEYTDNDIVPISGPAVDTLVVGSPGLYLDAFVGHRPSTEPYSEEMRASELAMRDAEIDEVKARAEYQRALARRISSLPVNITVAARALDLRTLELTFSETPPLGDWDIIVSNVIVRTISISAGDMSVTVTFRQDQDWLRSSTAYICRMVHQELETELYFSV